MSRMGIRTNDRRRLTAYDALLGRRTAALGVALTALIFLAMLGTDDAISTHAGRLGRLSALASLAGGGAALLALEQARSRGEMRALAATGVNPARSSLGAVVGGALVGLLGPVFAVVPGVDLTPLFPHALPAEAGWVAENGAWLDRVRAVRVAADGMVSWAGTPSPADVVASSPPFAATLVTLIVAALALPLWAAAPGPLLRRVWASFVVASAAVFVFHLVAAHRIGAMTLVIPPLLLFADALLLHRARPWS
ncbi:MAG TPA: hypothetical protein VK550_33185 [Polyangiaceae bacterium]|nr:hypothetical protein [Polyangiaceae bacterium]